MAKADDSSLDPEQLRAVQIAARRALDRASAWNVFPTPVSDILDAAQLRLAPASAFDPRRIMEYLLTRAEHAAASLKSAISKIFGIYDADECLIHIDHTVRPSKQNFLKPHETGHHELPTHRKLFRIFQDCEKNLDPTTADLFEREATTFARFVLFQGDAYRDMAADHKLNIKTPVKLAKEFGASIYASCREFARTNRQACVVYILEPIAYCTQIGARAQVRRI
ncbi:MAG: ImmA/IrrE family metallo-endopeptidase, partial [Xanthobacteraceae bacterium]